MTRVVITGLGAVSCLGAGVPAFWRGLLGGEGHPRPMPDPHAHMRTTLMYLVPEADVPAEPASFAHVPLGPGPRFGVAAAREAVADAGLDAAARRTLPVVVGVEMGNADLHEQRRAAGAPAVEPWAPLTVTGAAVGAALGATAANVSVGNACAASGYALTLAADLIRAGEADVVLSGGAEGAIRVAVGAFNRLGAADPVRCRPFDRQRQGTVFGAGGAMLVLESADRAARRGAVPYAELTGAAWSCDAHHPTAPDPDGTQVVRAMREALADAGVAADDVGGVVPHATGTQLNDVVETRALYAVFGPRAARLPLLGLKGRIGHTGGVAAAFGVLAAALMLRAGQMPPSHPLGEPDPECPVWLPADGPVSLSGSAVLVNAYAFGGNNASLVLTRSEGTP